MDAEIWSPRRGGFFFSIRVIDEATLAGDDLLGKLFDMVHGGGLLRGGVALFVPVLGKCGLNWPHARINSAHCLWAELPGLAPFPKPGLWAIWQARQIRKRARCSMKSPGEVEESWRRCHVRFDRRRASRESAQGPQCSFLSGSAKYNENRGNLVIPALMATPGKRHITIHGHAWHKVFHLP